MRPWLLQNSFKGLVMIGGIKILSAPAADNAARSATMCAGRFHGVFVIVTARMFRQYPLEVAEYHAIARVGKRTAILDGAQRVTRLRR
jgi:hypothetical protein